MCLGVKHGKHSLNVNHYELLPSGYLLPSSYFYREYPGNRPYPLSNSVKNNRGNKSWYTRWYRNVPV